MTGVSAPAGPSLGATIGRLDVAPRVTRSAAVDRARGLAVACMIVDHCCIVFGDGGPLWLRLSVGRISAPLFFLIGGHLVRRLSWRHGWVFLVGLALPYAVPWIDNVNVLVWYSVGAALLVYLRWVGLPNVLVVVVALAVAANFGWSPLHIGGHAFDGLPLLGLMALGAMLPRSAFAWGDRLPAFLGRLGRYPLTVYVGHLLVLVAIAAAAGIRVHG